MGAGLFREFFTLTIDDLLGRSLQYDLFEGLLAFLALVSTWGRRRIPGWTRLYGHHSIGEYEDRTGQCAFQKGGTGALAEALASVARSRGAQIRTDAPVERLLSDGGKVRGAELTSGDEFGARMVASGADPRRTILEMVDGKELPDEFTSAIQRLDFRGSMARVHIALDGLPDFVDVESGAGPPYRRTNSPRCRGPALRVELEGATARNHPGGLRSRVLGCRAFTMTCSLRRGST